MNRCRSILLLFFFFFLAKSRQCRSLSPEVFIVFEAVVFTLFCFFPKNILSAKMPIQEDLGSSETSLTKKSVLSFPLIDAILSSEKNMLGCVHERVWVMKSQEQMWMLPQVKRLSLTHLLKFSLSLSLETWILLFSNLCSSLWLLQQYLFCNWTGDCLSCAWLLGFYFAFGDPFWVWCYLREMHAANHY